MLNIQRHIAKHGLEETIRKFSLKTSEADGLILLNYNQIDSPKTPETNECRGLILNKEDMSVVCYPFHRFFNHQEGYAEEVDFGTADIEQKIDGSLLNLYFSPNVGEWRVSTRGMINADGQINDYDMTFADLFWKTLPNSFREFLVVADTSSNFIFELVSPYNRIVTRYEKPDLYLLGGRFIDTLEEMDVLEIDIIAKDFGVNRPKTYKCSNLDSLVEMFNEMHPTEEGFVVVDRNRKTEAGNYPRVKVKNPAYVALHHSIGAGGDGYMSYKNIIKLWKLGETEEVKSYYPEYKDRIELVENILNGLDNEVTERYNVLSKKGLTQKEFALRVKDLPYSAIMFALRNNKVNSARGWLLNATTDYLINFIGKEKL